MKQYLSRLLSVFVLFCICLTVFLAPLNVDAAVPDSFNHNFGKGSVSSDWVYGVGLVWRADGEWSQGNQQMNSTGQTVEITMSSQIPLQKCTGTYYHGFPLDAESIILGLLSDVEFGLTCSKGSSGSVNNVEFDMGVKDVFVTLFGKKYQVSYNTPPSYSDSSSSYGKLPVDVYLLTDLPPTKQFNYTDCSISVTYTISASSQTNDNSYYGFQPWQRWNLREYGGYTIRSVCYRNKLVVGGKEFQDAINNLGQSIQNSNQLQQAQNQLQQQANQLQQEQNQIQQEQSNTQKGIWQSIKDFFSSFFGKLGDLIVGLFIPPPEKRQELVDRFSGFFESHFGFLLLPFEIFIKLCDILVSSSSVTSLEFPSFSILGHQVWNSYVIDLAANPVASVVFPKIRIVTGIILVIGYYNYMRRVLERIIGGGF